MFNYWRGVGGTQKKGIMSLDVYLESGEPNEESLFWGNITHNLTAMADAAGIYQCLWRPIENGMVRAKDLLQPLTDGLAAMRIDPEKFKAFNAKNGWGTYDQFVPWIEEYLKACKENPDALIEIRK